MQVKGQIGFFDSGYGGLTILSEVVKKIPQYDYLYLGDNTNAPYGNHSFETVYRNTRNCVEWLFAQGCPLVILACNTASAKALRAIQHNDLPKQKQLKRVLGIIRPTVEVLPQYTTSKKIALIGTIGTVNSASYVIELKKYFPDITLYQKACPIWAALVEAGEEATQGADFFVQRDLQNLFRTDRDIDALLPACTHYPLLINAITKYLPKHIKLIPQGTIVANSLADYLLRRPEVAQLCSTNATREFCTTDSALPFNQRATMFWGDTIVAKQVVV